MTKTPLFNYKTNRQLHFENKKFYLKVKKNYLLQRRLLLEWPDQEVEDKLEKTWSVIKEVFAQYDTKNL